MLIVFDNRGGATDVTIRHFPLGDHGQVSDIDPCFTVTDDMRMRRFVVGGVDHEAHTIFA